jgi:hypothetical protein
MAAFLQQGKTLAERSAQGMLPKLQRPGAPRMACKSILYLILRRGPACLEQKDKDSQEEMLSPNASYAG